MAEVEGILALIDELRSEDRNAKLHAINHMTKIAEAIGKERTQEELVPFILELIEDTDDEILLALAKVTCTLQNYLEGEVHCLLDPLITLAGNEEAIVRDAAIESVKNIMPLLSEQDCTDVLLPLLKNAAASEFYSSRISSCALIPQCYEKTNDEIRKELIALFIELVQDDTPMVRRASGQNLNLFLGYISEQQHKKEIMQCFTSLISDTNESVRQVVLTNCLEMQEESSTVLNVLKGCAFDKSWRIRYAFAENIMTVSTLKSFETIVLDFIQLLRDVEPEVRSIAIDQLPKLASKITLDLFRSKVVPTFEALAKDPSQHVKLSLISTLCQISEYLGVDVSIQEILPVINQLLRDEAYEVRIGFTDNLDTLSNAIQKDKVGVFVVPILKQLMADTQWRVRLGVVKYIPQLGALLGQAEFDEKLGQLMQTWIEDSAFTIRQTTLESYKNLSESFGLEWVRTNVTPVLKTLQAHQIFTKRMTAILILDVLRNELDRSEMITILKVMANDRVPNVRFNVAKLLKKMGSGPDSSEIKLILDGLVGDEDGDVRYYAIDAAKAS